MKFLDLKMLTEYSKKLKEYIAKKVSELNTRIDESNLEYVSNKIETDLKIEDNKSAITLNGNKIDMVESDVDKLQEDMLNIPVCDGHPQGAVVNFNGVEQFIFRNVKAGDVIEIPNASGQLDFVIDCYEDISEDGSVEHRVVALDSNNRNNFTCDEAYVDVTPEGLKPKTDITLVYTKEELMHDGEKVFIYTSEALTADMVRRIDDITSIEEV